MNNKFSLFDSHPFLKPLSEDESACVQKFLKLLSQYKKQLPSLSLPEKITDHMLLCFLKAYHEGKIEIAPKAWHHFLEIMFMQGLSNQISSPTLRNYLLIHLAKNQSLSKYCDEKKCLELAYSALHGGPESRKILLMYAKHFNINDPKILEDLAYKGILLGGALDIDLNQFMPQKPEVIKQLLFLISHIDKKKAQEQLLKIAHYCQGQIGSIQAELRACI